MTTSPENISRRDFIKTTAAASLAAAIPGNLGLHAQGSDTIRVGVIGCGGRGTGAAIDCLNSSPGVEIVALFDPFQDRIDGSLKTLREKVPAAVKVKPETLLHRPRRLQEAPAPSRRSTTSSWPPRPASGRSISRPRSRPASTSSWRSRSPSIRSASARSSPPPTWPRKKGCPSSPGRSAATRRDISSS